ncbi:DUF3326 domain-containing protein [Candidatus Kaiserbacteria bacterium]|nr:DUF3326 domain-containing protein [Candidatus Kaiserbacteria bacterium]
MKVVSEVFEIPKSELVGLSNLKNYTDKHLTENHFGSIPIRFIVTEEKNDTFVCEIDLIIKEADEDNSFFDESVSIFDYNKREFENTDKFTAALVIPTGIGAEIGGHCGDGNVAARLIASACDTLVTHPNTVNASDINEMTENTLYVEGSTMSKVFMGTIGLQKVRSNRILTLMDTSDDKFFNDEIINSVSSARVTLGIDSDVYQMKEMIESDTVFTPSGRAAGGIKHLENLMNTIKKFGNEYDAIALATAIEYPEEKSREYFKTKDEVVNPWGGAEAIITHSTTKAFGKPCAHSPLTTNMEGLHLDYQLGVVDPRKAPETSSVTYLHCILKGLQKSPKLVSPDKGLNLNHISCLVIPQGCIGLPVLACLENDIPVIAVKNNNEMKNDLQSLPFKRGKLFYADSYVEAAGIMSAIKAGVSLDTLNRPISPTGILKD